eukprot:COSAG02_NODE_82_length_39723_cov_247.146650_28_plen_57_part_00
MPTGNYQGCRGGIVGKISTGQQPATDDSEFVWLCTVVVLDLLVAQAALGLPCISFF